VAAERSLTAPAWRARLHEAVRSPARAAVAAFALLLLASLAVRIWLTGQITTPWIMIDELVYAEMAKSFAESGDFLVRGAPVAINNVVYPAAIAPAWFVHPMTTTYAVAKAINVVVMTSAAIPLYLWARRLVAPGYALVAVALTLVMPSFIYTGMLMTENAFLPAFVLAAFSFALVLERPTLVRQIGAFAAILLSVGIRYQGLVLLLVLPTAILLKVLLELRVERRPQPLLFAARELRRYWISLALLAGAVLFYVGLQVARGHALKAGLGSYGAVVGKGYTFDAARHWVLLHFAELGFSVGMLPASAFLLLLALAFVRGGTRTEAERGFIAVTAAAVPWIVVEVAVFASRFSLRVEDRYMFFLAPLLFLALVLWLDRGLPRPPLLALVAGVVPAALLFALPLGSLLNVSIYSDTFGLIPLLRLANGISGGIPEARKLMLVGGAVAAAGFVLWPRRGRPDLVFPAAVGAFLVLASYPIVGALRDYAQNLRDTAGLRERPSWIDSRIGTAGDASFLLGTTSETWPETLSLWQQEFWNRSLGDVYNLSTPEPAGGPETPVQVASTNGVITSKLTGAPVRTRYVVSNLSFGLDGKLLAADPPFALYRTPGLLRVAEARIGIYGDGWMSADASYTRFVSRPRGRLTVTLSRAAWRGPDVPGHVRVQLIPLSGPHKGDAVATRRWTLHSGGGHGFTLRTPTTPFVVTVHVQPTFSPSQFGSPDTRQLGAQVTFAQPADRH
jgi:hypothetical protein